MRGAGRISRISRTLAGVGLGCLGLATIAVPAHAATLTSASYRHVHGAPVSVAANTDTALTSTAASPGIGSLEISVGEAPTVAPSGGSADLVSVFPGLWSAFLGSQGGYAGLDLDADLVAFFLDPDDDGDGLLDYVETATGVFVSALDTGTNPFVADTDGDGFSDGAEVLAASDPTDPLSTPAAAPVPLAGALVQLGLLTGLAIVSIRALRREAPRGLS